MNCREFDFLGTRATLTLKSKRAARSVIGVLYVR